MKSRSKRYQDRLGNTWPYLVTTARLIVRMWLLSSSHVAFTLLLLFYFTAPLPPEARTDPSDMAVPPRIFNDGEMNSLFAWAEALKAV